MNFSSARSKTSSRYSFTPGNFALDIFMKTFGASPVTNALTMPSEPTTKPSERSSKILSGTWMGIRWRRLSGNCVSTSFFNLRTMTVEVSTWFNSIAFRTPTILFTNLPPPTLLDCCKQYRARNSAYFAGKPGIKPHNCGCNSSAELRVGVPERSMALLAFWSRGTTTFVRAAFHSLMQWLSSQITTPCGEPSGRSWKLPFLAPWPRRLYEMTYIFAEALSLSAALRTTWTFSGPSSSGSHCVACSFQTQQSDDGHTTSTGQSSVNCAAMAKACNVFPRPISSPMRHRPPRLQPKFRPSSW
mmetsp:Transcript_76583/g.214873  ORF Transcript_76583/g.214873 Transcript_76583/m.214873 type:complete len:301 (+) Transcript_76583:779-1681(+)